MTSFMITEHILHCNHPVVKPRSKTFKKREGLRGLGIIWASKEQLHELVFRLLQYLRPPRLRLENNFSGPLPNFAF
jgi:hypothetical protein